jgi:hypothetical protein
MQTLVGVAISICSCHPGKRRGWCLLAIVLSSAHNHPFDPIWGFKTNGSNQLSGNDQAGA